MRGINDLHSMRGVPDKKARAFPFHERKRQLVCNNIEVFVYHLL